MEVGNQGQVPGVVYTERQSLDTVRALHQTVVSLRAALEQSRAELKNLRQQVQGKVNPIVYEKTIEKLSLENHILRQRVLSSENVSSLGIELTLPLVASMTEHNQKPFADARDSENPELAEQKDSGVIEKSDEPKVSGPNEPDCLVGQISLENGEEIEMPIQDEDQSLSSATSRHEDGTPQVSKGESEDSEELDDIELIFTTDDKELSGLHEDLVSIAESETWNEKRADESDTKHADTNSNLRHTWTQSVFVETDISKCGVIDESSNHQVCRRYTLPNPSPYRPIIHREAVSGSKGYLIDQTPSSPRPLLVKFSQTVRNQQISRPILVEKHSNRQESEAQTDITALPAHWRSESFLAHNKIASNFTTLPSKFSIPVSHCAPRKQSLRLSEKTQEARRVLLSDINFTSMVPELSRSADHLCKEVVNTSNLCKNYPRAFSYMKNADSILSPGGNMSRVPWSPCDCCAHQQSWECYQGSLMSIPSPSVMDMSDSSHRPHFMKPSMSSLDTCWNSSFSVRPNNWSVPSSPTRCHRSRSVPFSRSYLQSQPEPTCPNRRAYSICCPNSMLDSKLSISSSSRTFRPLSSSKSRNRVTFKDHPNSRRPGQSLPDLRIPLEHDSGEDSTDSLIEESEEFLRRSIDSMVTGADYSQSARKSRRSRRHSEPHPAKDFEPPKSSQPFLAKVPRDLKLNFLVKVITPEGRVVVGRVRYVGFLPGKGDESFIGVQLSRSVGNSDGSFNGRRFFDWLAGYVSAPEKSRSIHQYDENRPMWMHTYAAFTDSE